MPEPLPFEEVYRLHCDRVLRFCATQVGNQTLAEDLASETFKRAYAAYDRVRPDPDGVHAWLFRIARNTITDHRRRGLRWLRAFGRLKQNAAISVDVESTAATRERVRAAFAALAAISERDRMLVSLRVGADLSYAEIGSVMGLTENNARTATNRAFERMRKFAGEGVE